MQLDGLATGMDTNSMINQLVQLEMRPIENYQKEISEVEEIKGAWRELNSGLDELGSKTTDLKMSSTFNSRSASSSNEDAVTATAENSSDEANYGVTVKSTAQSQRMFGSNFKDGFSADADVITLNETDIAIDAGDSLSNISNKINDADAGVKASIVDDRLVLETTETGEANALDPADETSISDKSGILTDLGIFDGNDDIANEPQQASDAVIDINGIENITSSTNTFSDAVDGVTFDINPDAVANDGTDTAFANVSVTKDTEKATDAVQGFVDQYNTVMDFLDGKTEYDEEEEEAAVLQGDSTAMRLQSKLRSMVTSRVKDSGDLNTLNSVGIEVDRDGVMSFDKAKFTEAIDQSPEEVMSLFEAESEADGFDGMAVKMDSYLDQLMQSNTGLIPRRVEFYDNRISSLNEDIEDVEQKVEMTRERYVEEFAAMEEAISEMNQQQSWMQNQLSSMGGSTNLMSSMM